MVFSSTVFLFLFLPLTVIIYYNPFLHSRKFRNIFLLIASLIFYAWGEPVNVFLMIFSIIAGFIIGKQIDNACDKKVRKLWLSLGITLYLVIFFIFKYLSFTASQIFMIVGKEADIINIALPIGISFYMFQLMSYLFDVYYGNAKSQSNILDLGLYISLFPQLIAGPIVRYSDIESQIINRHESLTDFSAGMTRFSSGLGKKVLLANYFGVVADNIFSITTGRSVLTAWVGAFAYTLQIFFDFSGYSDMAIGLGRIFGFHFQENFNYPYISSSVTEFWRRWHMSLSSWFRDYVYIPLGGSRVNRKRRILNLFIVWMLTGIWHGANWTFLLWGFIYFIVLLIERSIKKASENAELPRIITPISHIYTMVIVTICWVIFRSDSISRALSFIREMIIPGGNGLFDSVSLYYLNCSKWIFIAGIIFMLPAGPAITIFAKDHKIAWIIPLFTMVVFILSLISCISSSYNPFIYFNF